MNTRKDLSQAVTAEFPAHHFTATWTPLDVDLGAATHQGYVRKNNEDHYLVMRFVRSLENLLTNLDEHILDHSYTLTGYGMLVADGIGGMAGGEVASRLALTKLVKLLVDTPDWIMSLKRAEDIDHVLHRMSERFLLIDKSLREKAKSDVTLHGMGTTLTVAATLGNDLVIGHIGDSRAYHLRSNNLTQLTKDHTLAQALIDAGVAGRDDPAARSMRHVLTAALGSMDEGLEPQVQTLKMMRGDRLLLCTDGLTDMVDDKTITRVLNETDASQQACQKLIDLALAGGGLDNITMVVAHFKSPDRSTTSH